MPKRNVVLLVVDSLRKRALDERDSGSPRAPFLAGLSAEALAFERAYATECWTLPSHVSMFTGLLPSEHGAHFQSMAYAGHAPTIAEILAKAGYRTEAITRNSLFDGSVPGALRGFQRLTQPLAEVRTRDLALHAVVALAKPRVRRLIRESGFFHAAQKGNRDFLWRLVRMGMPGDRLALQAALERMDAGRRSGTPYFLFLNLYDVHAPYPPTETSALPALTSPAALREALSLPWVLPKIASHAYLRPGFRLSERSQGMLVARYHRAIELMDQKLAWFWDEAKGARLLDDTVVVVTSDHGEGFGEHGLYLHDASVYETHLHVPLWVHWPGAAPGQSRDVVSLSALFGLLRAAAERGTPKGTLLDPAWRASRPLALAEHFHYPHGRGVLPNYRQNLAAVVGEAGKVVRRGTEIAAFDLTRDPGELTPIALESAQLGEALRDIGLAPSSISLARDHLGKAALTRRAA